MKDKIEKLISSLEGFFERLDDKTVHIGEYALSNDTEGWFIDEDFKMLKEEFEYVNELDYNTPSSKSGTVFSVTVDTDALEDQMTEFREVLDEDVSTLLQKVEVYGRLKEINTKVEIINEKINKEVLRVQAWVEGFALGKRSGCFSNGEVIFTPTKTAKKAYKYTESFTPYYNPNEEKKHAKRTVR